MIQKIILALSIVLLLTNCNSRQKDPDELVKDDYITEINGIYYMCDCEIHCGEKKMTTEGKNYYENRRIQNTWKLTNGRPDSLWVYYDSLGKKAMEIKFDRGRTLSKIKY